MYNIGDSTNIRNTGHSTKEQFTWRFLKYGWRTYMRISWRELTPYLQDPRENSKLNRRPRGVGLGGGLVSTNVVICFVLFCFVFVYLFLFCRTVICLSVCFLLLFIEVYQSHFKIATGYQLSFFCFCSSVRLSDVFFTSCVFLLYRLVKVLWPYKVVSSPFLKTRAIRLNFTD